MKVTLTKIVTKTVDSKGNQLVTRAGKPYTRLAITCNEYGDTFLSGFQGYENKNWKVGDVVEIEVQKVYKDGKEYLNFKTLGWKDLIEKRILALEIAEARRGGSNSGKTVESIPYPEDDINPDDIPF